MTDVKLPDFDELAKMAKEDPEALEALRLSACEELIQSAPQQYQRKLRGLQFRIDMERRKAKTPMAACIKISEMMHDSFTKLREALVEAQGVSTPQVTKDLFSKAAADNAPSAAPIENVISFPNR